MRVAINITDLGLRAMLADMDTHGSIVRPAAVRAINRGLQSIRRPVARSVATQLKIRPQKLISRRIKIDRATTRKLEGTIRILQRPVPAILLAGARQSKSGVRASGHSYPHGFIAHGKNSGKRHVFVRRGKARLPIDAQRIQIADETERALAKQMPAAADRMATVLTQEIKYRMRQKGYA